MSSYVFYENLPDGVHDVLLGPQNGLYLTGYDSRRRITFVLYAPPFGQRLRYISQLPYRDYGQFAPTVLGAHEESRGTLLILLYQRPISWGSESMALYRVSPEDGSQTLLSSTPSPFWPPTALLPRSDGSVLVATSGSGPLLRYDGCNATACAGPSALASAASNATGKAGLAEVRTAHGKTLCLVTGSDQLTGRGGSICCERRDGSLQTIWAPATATATAAASASAAADSPSPAPVLPPAPPPEGAASEGGAPERDPPGGDPARRARLEAPEAWGSGNRSSSSSSSSSVAAMTQSSPSLLARGPPVVLRRARRGGGAAATAEERSGAEAGGGAEGGGGAAAEAAVEVDSLLVVSLYPTSEYGFEQGAVNALRPRAALLGETCGDAGCWAAPQRVASSLSNPRGVAVSAALGKLYVVEQNTLRGASYELFSGDVLQLCTDGRYECGAGQNAGECECAVGFGGACCDTPSSSSGVVSLLATAGWWGAFAPPLLAAFALLSFGLRRRRASPLPAGWSLGDASLLEARDARPMPPRVARRRGLFAQLDSQQDAASLAPVNVGGSALSLASLLAPMRQPLLGEGGACSGSHQSLLSMPVAWGGGATREPSSCDGSALGDFDLPFDSTLPSPHGDRSSVGSISRDRTPLSTPQRPPPAGEPGSVPRAAATAEAGSGSMPMSRHGSRMRLYHEVVNEADTQETALPEDSFDAPLSPLSPLSPHGELAESLFSGFGGMDFRPRTPPDPGSSGSQAPSPGVATSRPHGAEWQGPGGPGPGGSPGGAGVWGRDG